MTPRVGAAPSPARQYRMRPGVYAVLLRAGRVLLTHQSAPTPEFQLPGGGVDPGEHIVPALHREIYEETGWHVGPTRRLGAFRRFTYMPEYDLWAEKHCTVYVARPSLRLGPPTEPDHTAHWVPLAQAMALVGNDGDRMFLGLIARLGRDAAHR